MKIKWLSAVGLDHNTVCKNRRIKLIINQNHNKSLYFRRNTGLVIEDRHSRRVYEPRSQLKAVVHLIDTIQPFGT